MNEPIPADYDFNLDLDLDLEPECHELHGDPLRRGALLDLEIDRRELFKIAGRGIVVLFALPSVLAGQESGEKRRGGRGGGRMPAEIGAWLHVGEDGAVTAYTGKVEVGQGIRTSLAQVVAEELRAPMEYVRLVMADTALVPFDSGTAGSQTTPVMAAQLRRVAAAARELLVDLAAREWKEDRGLLEAAAGRVVCARTPARAGSPLSEIGTSPTPKT